MSKLKLTPRLVRQLFSMTQRKLTNAQIVERLGLAKSTFQAVRSGLYPMDVPCLAAWTDSFGALGGSNSPASPSNSRQSDAMHTKGAADAIKAATAPKIQRSKKLAPEVSTTSEAVPVKAVQTNLPKEDPMLLQNQALSPEARKHFALPRNPFVDDVQGVDDVYQSKSVRYVRATLLDAALHHGFVAITGESGAGKSTLAEDLEERIKLDKRDVLVVRPYVLAMEATDAKGKTLKSAAIAEALIAALDPAAPVRSNPQARYAQLHTLLKASRAAGRRHLLVVEEAHCLPTATLKHLKRFLELKDGMQRLLGVALIGQPELRERLGSHNAEVREVMQRCEVVELEALDGELEAYLRHKFARFELKYEDVFAADAADAIRARLIHLPRGAKASEAKSLCFPLVVNNLVCRAMNAAARVGFDKVDADVIAGC